LGVVHCRHSFWLRYFHAEGFTLQQVVGGGGDVAQLMPLIKAGRAHRSHDDVRAFFAETFATRENFFRPEKHKERKRA
jgi:hypothetical protein